MDNFKNDRTKKQINNLIAKIKLRYPHLYEETGGRYIRKILRDVLDNTECGSGSSIAFQQQ